jgi:hypothetical protein
VRAKPLFLFRYAMKPIPTKPRIIMAQLDGSGTFEEKLPSKGVNLKMLSV